MQKYMWKQGAVLVSMLYIDLQSNVANAAVTHCASIQSRFFACTSDSSLSGKKDGVSCKMLCELFCNL